MGVVGTLIGISLSLGGGDAKPLVPHWQQVARREARQWMPAVDMCKRQVTTRIVTLPSDRLAQAHLSTDPEAPCTIDMGTDFLDRQEKCGAWVHERVHLARGDSWHSPDPHNPLYYSLTITGRCLTL